MSNKSTPDKIRTNINYYKTPIKETNLILNNNNIIVKKQSDKKIIEGKEKVKDKEKEVSFKLNSSYTKADNDKRNESNNKKIENEGGIIYPRTNSNYKKYFQSPYSNFLFHSPVSFLNYLNNFSRNDQINVLDFKNKQKINVNLNKKIESMQMKESSLNIIDQLNTVREKFTSQEKEKSNEINIKHSKKLSKEKSNNNEKLKVKLNNNNNIYVNNDNNNYNNNKINQEEKENIFLQENDINTNSNWSLLELSNSNMKKVSTNKSYSSGNYSIINVNSYSNFNNYKDPFENNRNTFKNLNPDLDKINKDDKSNKDFISDKITNINRNRNIIIPSEDNDNFYSNSNNNFIDNNSIYTNLHKNENNNLNLNVILNKNKIKNNVNIQNNTNIINDDNDSDFNNYSNNNLYKKELNKETNFIHQKETEKGSHINNSIIKKIKNSNSKKIFRKIKSKLERDKDKNINITDYDNLSFNDYNTNNIYNTEKKILKESKDIYLNDLKLQSPIIIKKNKIIIDSNIHSKKRNNVFDENNYNYSKSNKKNFDKGNYDNNTNSFNKIDIKPNNLNLTNFKETLNFTPVRNSSEKKRIFFCINSGNGERENDSTFFNTSQKKMKIKKRLRKSNWQIEYLEECFKNKNWMKEKEIINEASTITGLSMNKVYKWLWDQRNKEILMKNKNCIFQVQNY
jgi:hypothetical protein